MKPQINNCKLKLLNNPKKQLLFKAIVKLKGVNLLRVRAKEV